MPAMSQKVVNRFVVICVALGFLVLVGVGVLGISVMRENLTFSGWVTHTYQVEQAVGRFQNLDERMETARRGFLLTHDARFDKNYEESKAQLDQSVNAIQVLTIDNPAQQSNVVALRKLVHSQIAGIDDMVLQVRAGGAANFSYDGAGIEATRAIRAQTARMAAAEEQLLATRNRARQETLDKLTTIVLVAGLLLLVVAAGSIWVILAFTRDLNASREELARLNVGLEDEVRARTADLQRANDEIQRFAYIVSHDLRSPLVNVMGFTSELEAATKPLAALIERAEIEAPQILTADAKLAVTSDLPESLGFIRSSTQKMDRLINAILRLSREGRRVLTAEPVDMQRMLDGIADSLKHRSHELGARIEVAPAVPALVSDRLAVEQIFSNLIENALKYLKPGRPGQIVVRGQRRGDRIVYEIQDNGRGIDPKDHERIFELFRRSGAQDQAGEGIGLAHVRALAYRLGGTVICDSALDQGATFRVSLPAKLSLEGAAA
jgi:signal transduction histidine kinase